MGSSSASKAPAPSSASTPVYHQVTHVILEGSREDGNRWLCRQGNGGSRSYVLTCPHTGWGGGGGEDTPADRSHMCPMFPGSLRGLQPRDHIGSKCRRVHSTKQGGRLVYKRANFLRPHWQPWDTLHMGLWWVPQGD